MPRRAKTKPAETDLYPLLHAYLTAQGYTARGEVKHCDIAAVKGDDLIVIEMKLALNLSLVAQGVRRQQMTDSVYLAVPRPPNHAKWIRQMRGAFRVLRRLELGLLLVSLRPGKPPVEVVFHPLPLERRKRRSARRAILEEIGRRSGDFNVGGSARRPLVTAYRENAIQIACYLADSGEMKPRQLRTLGTGPKTLSILSRNVYGWFSRIDRGLYAVTPKGREALVKYPQLVRHYGSLPAARDTKPSA
jgi:hypothetical protein